MKHMSFEYNGKTYSLTGSVITVFRSDGLKLDQWFYADFDAARLAFLEIEAAAA